MTLAKMRQAMKMEQIGSAASQPKRPMRNDDRITPTEPVKGKLMGLVMPEKDFGT